MKRACFANLRLVVEKFHICTTCIFCTGSHPEPLTRVFNLLINQKINPSKLQCEGLINALNVTIRRHANLVKQTDL